jgi:hypothetical protein
MKYFLTNDKPRSSNMTYQSRLNDPWNPTGPQQHKTIARNFFRLSLVANPSILGSELPPQDFNWAKLMWQSMVNSQLTNIVQAAVCQDQDLLDYFTTPGTGERIHRLVGRALTVQRDRGVSIAQIAAVTTLEEEVITGWIEKWDALLAERRANINDPATRNEIMALAWAIANN